MAIIVKEEKKEWKLIPAGMYQAVCFGVWDIGIQETNYKGVKKFNKQLIIGWELEERDEKGKRSIMYKTYNISFYPKSKLRLDLESWRGKSFTKEELDGFDVEKLVGVNCMLNVVHYEKEDRTYTNITSISKLMASLPKITAEINGDFIPSRVLNRRKLAESNVVTEKEEQDEDTLYANATDEIPF